MTKDWPENRSRSNLWDNGFVTASAPDGTPLGNLRHTLAAYPDTPDDKLAITASSNVYGAEEPGVIVSGGHGATFTGLTWGDLRALLAELAART